MTAIESTTRSIAAPRPLGKTGMLVSPVGMGCMGLTHASGDPLPDAEAKRVVRAAYDMGYTFFDTAECYVGLRADGTVAHNEDVVGAALAPVRDQVVIATKFGVAHNADRTLSLDSSPATIRRSVEGSLRRLRTDHIDLYYQHRIDPKVAPEEVAETMGELIAEGKILAWGISETGEDYLRRAHAVCPVSAVENRYSMAARWHAPMIALCRELGITFVAFSPMANGLLTGAYGAKTKFEGAQDYRGGMPQYTEAGQAAAAPLIELLHRVASAHGATPAQVSLAWMLAEHGNVVPIPGSRKPERLRENLGAARVALTAGELAKIDALLATVDIPVFGGHAAGAK